MQNTQNLCTWIFYRLYLASSLHIKGTGQVCSLYTCEGRRNFKVVPSKLCTILFGEERFPKIVGREGENFTFGAHQIQLSSRTHSPPNALFGELTWNFKNLIIAQESYKIIGLLIDGQTFFFFFFFFFHTTNITPSWDQAQIHCPIILDLLR